MKDIYFGQLFEYNRTYKDVDELYTNYAKLCGLSESDFWILYALAENGSSRTQKDLCEWWSISKQTINSALKNLEKEGVVTLQSADGNKKIKYISLTDKGLAMVEKYVIPLMKAEQAAFGEMGDEQAKEYLRLNKLYADELKQKIARIDFL